MANINPQGIDLSTGQMRRILSTDTLTDNGGSPVTVTTGLPKRYIEGLVVEHANGTTSTQATVTPGSCRDITNTADIALSTKTTADAATSHSAANGLAQLNGVDEKGLDNLTSGAITCSQSGTTITATADITPHYNPRSITGTISATGTALTGIGTKFLSELWLGDLVGTSTTYGWCRVVSVLTDTTATLVAAFPGGNPSGISAEVIHHATIWPGTNTIYKQVVLTMNAAGTSIGVFASTTIAASSPLTIGVFPDNNIADEDSAYHWMFVWLVDNGSTPGILLSTQHEELLAPPSGYTVFRRIGALLWSDAEDSPGYFTEAHYHDDPGHARYCQVLWTPTIDPTVPSPGGYQNFYPASTSGTEAQVPRTATRIRYGFQLTNQSTTNELYLSVGRGRYPSGAMTVGACYRKETLNKSEWGEFELSLDEGQGFWVTVSLTAGVGNCRFYRHGFTDSF